MKLKRSFSIYFILGILFIGLFSCSSDDDEVTPVMNWGTYSEKNLNLNGKDVENKDVSIKITGVGTEGVKVVLNNVVVGEPSLELPAVVTRSGDTYSLICTDTNKDRKVAVTGSVTGGKLNVTVDTEVISPIVANWSLKITENKVVRATYPYFADVYFNISTGSQEVDQQIKASIPPMIGNLIAIEVESVTANFDKKGLAAIAYKENSIPNVSQSEGLTITDVIPIYFYTRSAEGQVYLAAQKADLEPLLEAALQLLGGAVKMDDIKALLLDSGIYYAIPLKYKVENNHAYFYITKDMISKVYPIVSPLIDPEILKNYKDVIDAMLNASVLEFGLGFDKK